MDALWLRIVTDALPLDVSLVFTLQPHDSQRLQQRIACAAARHFGTAAGALHRFVFAPQVPQQTYWALLVRVLHPPPTLVAQANSLFAVDSYPHSSARGAVEALALGVPIVTLPSGVGTGRPMHALSSLQLLALHDVVAATREDFVHLIGQLAHDVVRWSEIRQRIAQRVPLLWRHNSAVPSAWREALQQLLAPNNRSGDALGA